MLNQFEEIRDTLYKFIETRVGLLEIETRGYIERIILRLVYTAFLLMVSVVIAMFLLLLLAIYLNILLQSVYLGYLIVTGFFILLLVILLAMRKQCLVLIRWILEKTLSDDDTGQIN